MNEYDDVADSAEGEGPTAETNRVHRKLLAWMHDAIDHLAYNRQEQATDDDYFDNEHWTEERKSKLRQRGQEPMVINETKIRVRWILGTQTRSRVDWRVLPTKEEDADAADSKSKLMKYVYENSRLAYLTSRAFKGAVVPGVGWLEAGIRRDPTDDPIYMKVENWRNIIYDYMNIEDFDESGRYLFKIVPVDLDVAVSMFPEHEEALRREASPHTTAAEYFDVTYPYWLGVADGDGRVPSFPFTDQNMTGRREIVWLIEGWWREAKNGRKFSGGRFKGMAYNETDPEMASEAEGAPEILYDALVMEMRYSVFTENFMLHESPSPYRHGKFPQTPILGQVRARDGALYGVVRDVRDLQNDINKRFIKAQHILNTAQVIFETGALKETKKGRRAIEHIRQQAARPDGVMELAQGGKSKFEIRTDRSLADGQMQMLDLSKQMIMHGVGVNDDNLGRQTNAQSGKAILARQDEGSVSTSFLFENLRLALQTHGEKVLSLIEQAYSAEKAVRITGERGAIEWMNINQPEWDEETGQWRIVNDITATRADFVISEQDWRETMRLAMFDQLIDMVTTKLPPDIGLQLMDLVIEESDLPGKDALVKRIRKITGHIDEDDPESEDMILQKQQEDEQSRRMDDTIAQLELRLRAAQVAKTEAEAKDREATAKKKDIETSGVAFDVGEKVQSNPAAAEIGSSIEDDSENQGDLVTGN